MHKEFRDYLTRLADHKDLGAKPAADALQQIVRGEVSSEETAAFLFGMRAKGETVEELTSFVRVMRAAAVKVDVDTKGAVDLCGTGGDHSGTFNISTAAMFVVAGAGIPVLKHGNRSVSSRCGSADVLEELGVVVDLRKKGVEEVFKETGLAFMYAPNFHPAMKHVMPARKALRMRTFFNILGPLLNPAAVRRQVVGAFNLDIARTMIHILAHLDTEKAYTVSAHDGLDEVSLTSRTELFELQSAMVRDPVSIRPEDLGYEPSRLDDLKGGDREKNAEIIRNVLQGSSEVPHRNIVLLNSIFGIHVSGRTSSLEEARQMAEDSIDSGKAYRKLNEFAEATQSVLKE